MKNRIILSPREIPGTNIDERIDAAPISTDIAVPDIEEWAFPAICI